MRTWFIASVVCLTLSVLSTPAAADLTFGWSGAPIQDGDDYDFKPSGTAVFSIDGNVLTLVITNTTPQTIYANWQVLTGFAWNITDPAIILVPLDAKISQDSKLLDSIGNEIPNIEDLSSEWAFRDDINAGYPFDQSYAISAVGSLNYDGDHFSAADRFDTSSNLWDPPGGSLNGPDGGLVGAMEYFDPNGGFHGPVVSHSLTIRWIITNGGLTENEINYGDPFFGSDGVGLPEPNLLALLGIAAAAAAIRRRRRAAA